MPGLTPARDVGCLEPDVAEPQLGSLLTGQVELDLIHIEAGDAAVRADHARQYERDFATATPHVEAVHPRRHTDPIEQGGGVGAVHPREHAQSVIPLATASDHVVTHPLNATDEPRYERRPDRRDPGAD